MKSSCWSEGEYCYFFSSLIGETKETKDSEAGNNSSCSALKRNKQMDTVNKMYFLSSYLVNILLTTDFRYAERYDSSD